MNKKKSDTEDLDQELRKYEDWALEDLRDLVRVLESYVQSKTSEQIEQLKEETKQKFAALGVDPTTVFESTKTDGRSLVKSKYQHPENAAVTWSGRGRKPRWVTEWLNQNPGGDIEDLAIGRERQS